MTNDQPSSSDHFDYYGAAKQIVANLTAAGDKNSADLITEKLEAGSTATEIIMGVRWAIQECLKTREKRMGDLDKKMVALIARIDGALK